jgi:hypothetical protein
MYRHLLLISAVLLAGCSWSYRPDCVVGFASNNCAPGTVGYDQAQQAKAQQAANAANDDAKCQSYGLQHGSAGYAQCRMTLDNQRAQVAASDRAIVLQHVLNGH